MVKDHRLNRVAEFFGGGGLNGRRQKETAIIARRFDRQAYYQPVASGRPNPCLVGNSGKHLEDHAGVTRMRKRLLLTQPFSHYPKIKVRYWLFPGLLPKPLSLL